MGVETRPPLPAATESSWTDNGNETEIVTASDLATNVSRRTDRTSLTLPEDGSPVTVPVKTTKTERGKVKSRGADQSQTSFLIEYFEGAANSDNPHSRPSVRVKVTPHAKSSKASDAVKITELNKGRTSSYSRAMPLASSLDEGIDAERSAAQVDILNQSEISSSSISRNQYIDPASEISSMPADSMLDGPVTITAPEHEVNRSVERDETVQLKPMDTLRTPSQRQRSLSRERITQKVIEKLGQEQSEKKRSSKSHSRGLSLGDLDDGSKSSRRRSSKSMGDSDRGSASVESSLLSGRGHGSNVSGYSKSSINNPKLLQTVEDAIRRLILPEIETLKREQSVHYNREKFDRGVRNLRDSTASDEYTSRDLRERKLSKASSEPRLKPKVVLNRDANDPGTTLSGDSINYKKTRKSSRGSTSTSRRDSLESSSRTDDRSYRRKTGEKSYAKEAAAVGIIGGVLTAAALKQHESKSDRDLKDSSERRKRRSSGRSRSSMADTEGEEYIRKEIPPMPMRSAIQDSELTRDSILSAASTDRPSSRHSRGTRTPVREVGRSSPRVVTPSRESPRTPTTPRNRSTSRDNRSPAVAALYSPRSDRSLSSKSKDAGLVAAAVGAAGVGTAVKNAYAKRQMKLQSPEQYNQTQTHDDRGVSPVQSDGSYQVDSTGINRDSLITNDNEPSISSVGVNNRDSTFSRDIDQEAEAASYQDDKEYSITANEEDWYEQQHKLNNHYRESTDYESRQYSPSMEYNKRETHYSENSMDGHSYDKDARSIQDIGANPKYVYIPSAAESAVGSLVEPSLVSSRSDQPRSFLDSPTRESRNLEESSRDIDTSSADRWAALKEDARKDLLDHASSNRDAPSPPQSITQSVASEKPVISKNAIPSADDPMPEYDHIDIASEAPTDISIKDHNSIVDEEMDGPNVDRSDWTPPDTKRAGIVGPLDRDSPAFVIDNGSTEKPVTGLGIGPGESKSYSERQMQLTNQFGNGNSRDVESNYNATRESNKLAETYKAEPYQRTPLALKDEGYMSGQAYSPPSQPKLSSMVNPQLFDERDIFNDRDSGGNNTFSTKKRSKYESGVSYDGMASPLYDASTGRGINNIQSKDVVALMDHLTVRDGQRSARDTEILVTLVRSAAEMRNSFDEIKKYLGEQQLNPKRADVGPDKGAQRNLSGTRISPRSRATSTGETPPGKKKNIFQRALKGLGSKSSDDLARIEDMLMQLLDEVEDLKHAQGIPTQSSTILKTNSLDSYERLRAAPESGYEPEGHAGTSPTPNQSGYSMSSPISRQTPIRSGYGRRDSENRVSTVIEGDEDLEDHENYVLENQFENGERLLTPTQETTRIHPHSLETPRSLARPGMVSYDLTPGTGDKSKKHKSTSSSVFGIPKISRWSKTTASSNRPYSEASRSGSDVNVLPPDGTYEPSPDDRLRSGNYTNHDASYGSPGDIDHQSSSPLVQNHSIIDDPKYQANRHSLTLEHPQPRPGPTHRHQSHLETQAYQYNTPASPTSDAFGSVPSLARLPAQGYAGNRLSSGSGMGNLSPISSEGAYSEHSNGYAQQQQFFSPPRPPKILDHDPLAPSVPPKVGPPSATVSVHDHANNNGIHAREDEDYEMVDYEEDWMEHPPADRKRSPYSPGALLPPIEERYSMELERSGTPQLSPRPALGATNDTGMRKLTGPREMPGYAKKVDVKRYSGDSETF